MGDLLYSQTEWNSNVKKGTSGTGDCDPSEEGMDVV